MRDSISLATKAYGIRSVTLSNAYLNSVDTHLITTVANTIAAKVLLAVSFVNAFEVS